MQYNKQLEVVCCLGGSYGSWLLSVDEAHQTGSESSHRPMMHLEWDLTTRATQAPSIIRQCDANPMGLSIELMMLVALMLLRSMERYFSRARRISRGWKQECQKLQGKKAKARTGLLLLNGQLLPVALHAVAQGHPQVSLLLERHALPSLLDVGEGRVGDGVGGLGAAGDQGDAAAHEALAQQVRCR